MGPRDSGCERIKPTEKELDEEYQRELKRLGFPPDTKIERLNIEEFGLEFNLNKLLNENDLEQEEQDEQNKRKHYLIEIEDDKDEKDENYEKAEKAIEDDSGPELDDEGHGNDFGRGQKKK